jgi:hypothetical protein
VGHEANAKPKVPHHPDGGCLSRHVGKSPKDGENNPCSHRWQAYEKMKDTRDLYNWRKYESLAQTAQNPSPPPIGTARTTASSGNRFPKYYRDFLDPPKANAWDVTGDNFKVRCYDPYWHEAHHVVPNSTLANAISAVDDGKYTYTIQFGLAKEKYNLNDKLNMVMLPMDKPVAAALKLPRHRQTAVMRSHQAYSKKVASELDKILSPLAAQLAEHEERDYKSVKGDIERLSKRLFDAIVTSEAGALDDMVPKEFAAKPPTNQF